MPSRINTVFSGRTAGSFSSECPGGGTLPPQAVGRDWSLATATTAARGRKQGEAVGAAASKTQAKRCGCWVPQPGQWHAVGVTERFNLL